MDDNPVRMKSARHRRAMSAIARPTSGASRPLTASRPRRPYSAYTNRGSEEDQPKYDVPESNREWWRFYMKVQTQDTYAAVLVPVVVGGTEANVVHVHPRATPYV